MKCFLPILSTFVTPIEDWHSTLSRLYRWHMILWAMSILYYTGINLVYELQYNIDFNMTILQNYGFHFWYIFFKDAFACCAERGSSSIDSLPQTTKQTTKPNLKLYLINILSLHKAIIVPRIYLGISLLWGIFSRNEAQNLAILLLLRPAIYLPPF